MMIRSFRKERRATSRRLAQRFSSRLQLESLEDRVVPSAPDGTLLVATFPNSSATSPTFTGILGFNTSGQQVYQVSGPFTNPSYMTEGPDGTLYVTDNIPSGGFVWAVNPSDNSVSALPITGLDGPAMIAYVQASNSLIIVNIGDGRFGDNPGSIIQYNLTSHTRTVYSDNLLVPAGIVAVPGQNAVYICDENGNFDTDQTQYGYGAVYKFTFNSNPATVTTIAVGTPSNSGDFDHSVDLALDGSGNILVANTGNPRDGVTGSLFKISPSGQQSWIVQGPHQDGSAGGGSGFGAGSGTDSVEVGSNGLPFIGEIQGGTNDPAKILQVFGENPGANYSVLITGASATTSGPPLSVVEGMRTYHAVQTGPAATNTAVFSSLNPSPFGQSVTFTATVSSGGIPVSGGQLEFLDGSTVLDTETVSGGTASFATGSLSLGSHTITASYQGNSSFASSISTPIIQRVTQAPAATTNTVVTSSSGTSVFGQGVVFTATVTSSGGTPTGSVNFFADGSTLLGSVPLNGGVATIVTNALSVGSHSISATYVSNSSSFAGSSGNLTNGQTVNQASTTTRVTSSGTPALQGSPVVFTATVSVVSPGTTAVASPSGQLTFLDNGSFLGVGTLSPTSGGATATFSTSSLGLGSHQITAVFTSDGNFQGSTSPIFNQSITAAPATTTSTTVSSSASGNTSVYGQSVMFTATVSPTSGSTTPTGSVQFSYDGTALGGPVTLSNGVAVSPAISTLSVTTHVIQAAYTPSGNFSSSNGQLTQTVSRASTATTVTSSGSPVQQGTPVTFTATISVQSPGSTAGANPTGTVTFTDTFNNQTTTLGSQTLSSGDNGVVSIQVSNLAPGTHSIRATYSGDGNFVGSGSTAFSQVISQQPAIGTSTTVSSSASGNTSVYGQSVMFTATVSPTSGSTTPTGSVQFSYDGTALGGPVTLSNGVAVSPAISTLSVTTHVIQAAYTPSGNFSSSNGQLTQTVSRASTATTVTSSGSPVQQGTPVTFTATISVQSPGSTAGANPTGTVTFTDTFNNQTTTLGSQTLSSGDNGVVSIQVSTLAPGTHSIRATYSGDGNFVGSGSTAFSQVISQQSLTPTTTAVASSSTTSVFGQSVTFTATVSGSGGTPTGTVSFLDGSTNLGSGTLSGGVATFTTSTLSVGSHTITANYGGDNNFQGSTSSKAVTQSVQTAQTTTVLTATPNPSQAGNHVVFTATITVNSPGSTAAANPTGTVAFFDGSTQIGQSTVSTDSNGTTTATFAYPGLSAGTHTITASYSGDGNFQGSPSGPWTQTVNGTSLAGTNTTVTSSSNPSVFGQNVTFTATVSSSTSGKPTGTVTFFDTFQGQTTQLDQETLKNNSNGVVTFQTTALAVGTHSITASYSGDNTFAASTSSPLTQTVNAAAPTLTDGTILVASSPSSSHSSAPTGIIGVDPSSGVQFLVSSSGMFSRPMHIAEDTSGHTLYVSDLTASKTGAIIAVDPTSGGQSLVTTGQNINAPSAIVFFSGHLYVADEGNGSSVAPNIVDVTPSNGKQKLLISGGSLQMPVGLARANGNNLFVLDETAFGTGAIFQLDVAKGTLTVFSKGGGLFNHPVDLSVDQNGNLIVINQNASPSNFGSIVEVDRQTGAATLLDSHNIGPGVTSGAVNLNSGIIYVGTMTVGSTPAQIFSFDPASGDHASLTQDNDLDLVEGVFIYMAHGGGDAAAPNGSSPASFVVSPSPTTDTSILPVTPARSSSASASLTQTLPVQTDSQPSSLSGASTTSDGTTQAALSPSAVDSVFADWSNDSLQGSLGGGSAL